jgi:hypothetical protein
MSIHGGYVYIKDGKITYHQAKMHAGQINWAKLRLLQVFSNPESENSEQAGFHPEFLTDKELAMAREVYRQRAAPNLDKERRRRYAKRRYAYLKQQKAEAIEREVRGACDPDSDGI